MTTRRDFLRTGGLDIAALTLTDGYLSATVTPYVDEYITKKPAFSERKFSSKAVEETVKRVRQKIGALKLEKENKIDLLNDLIYLQK
ncbi:MAG: hypothetical protein LBF59_02230 [Prevotellaceae bacterium]|jgi:hypothetical protein|nr:hypothetical protein [Prevotellaceae bacterium]